MVDDRSQAPRAPLQQVTSRHFSVAGPLAAGAVALICLLWGVVTFRNGVGHTPDSGLYLFSAVRARLGPLAYATPSNYAPGLPLLIACTTPFLSIGNGAILVQVASFSITLASGYYCAWSIGRNHLVACATAVLVGFSASSAFAFSMQLSEGPLCAAYAVLTALWCARSRSDDRIVNVLVVAVAACTPLLKYASAFVPPLVAAFYLAERRPRLRPWRALAVAVLGSVPFVLYMIWNRIREGNVTSHPAARRSITENSSDAAATLVDSFTGWPLAFVVFLLALIVRRVWYARSARILCCPRAIFAGALGLAYLVFTAIGASMVHVDPLGQRLCAPGIVLIWLSMAMLAAHLLSTDAEEQAKYPAPAIPIAFAVAVLLASWQPLHESFVRPLWRAIRHKREKSTSVADWGFRSSATQAALIRFYDAELESVRTLSVTFIEARRRLGHVRRGWIMMGGVLANTPGALPNVGKLRLAEVADNVVVFEVVNRPGSLLLLDGDVTESRGIPGVSSVDEAPVQQFVAGILERVTRAAQSRGQAQHWVLVPREAKWFQPAAAPQLTVVRTERLGEYVAYLLQFG